MQSRFGWTAVFFVRKKIFAFRFPNGQIAGRLNGRWCKNTSGKPRRKKAEPFDQTLCKKTIRMTGKSPLGFLNDKKRHL